MKKQDKIKTVALGQHVYRLDKRTDSYPSLPRESFTITEGRVVSIQFYIGETYFAIKWADDHYAKSLSYKKFGKHDNGLVFMTYERALKELKRRMQYDE